MEFWGLLILSSRRKHFLVQPLTVGLYDLRSLFQPKLFYELLFFLKLPLVCFNFFLKFTPQLTLLHNQFSPNSEEKPESLSTLLVMWTNAFGNRIGVYVLRLLTLCVLKRKPYENSCCCEHKKGSFFQALERQRKRALIWKREEKKMNEKSVSQFSKVFSQFSKI